MTNGILNDTCRKIKRIIFIDILGFLSLRQKLSKFFNRKLLTSLGITGIIMSEHNNVE
jgi:hypothetical protein